MANLNSFSNSSIPLVKEESLSKPKLVLVKSLKVYIICEEFVSFTIPTLTNPISFLFYFYFVGWDSLVPQMSLGEKAMLVIPGK